MQFSTRTQPITVNIASLTALRTAVRGRFASGDGFALATVNLDHLVKLQKDVAFCEAYLAQDFVVADGNPIVWLSRLAGKEVALLPGADLVRPLMQWAADDQVPVALIGGTERALTAAAHALRAEVPHVDIVATIAPPMGFDPDSAAAEIVLQQAADAGARMVFLALGAPKQERLAARGRQLVPHMCFASIGAGLDFWAGTQRRAPLWVRKLALEWLWRLLSNPARLLTRYLRCLTFLPVLVLAALKQRNTSGR
ncbi:WecB/TagA/CpsF family glycosyltransferase [Shimia sp. MMG029]|uniref:WecB/TagA/CpsF family glycosyltransferase n=1 Tax=Shimia sp. MMG029 TaxID=3021978 RepID=UPI0022FE491A|nr:WecB/TagA/CpsF family glycosyltransferase [Shimia sp. MMG029]MDA5558611.1 WecB/TagA/CpsF family glycosyltransferase [Shimia sp. MMG029]